MSTRLIPEQETLSCEFKSDMKRLPDSEIVDTVVALSNTDGGCLYLGVEDDGVPTGVHHTHEDETRLAALIANRTVPPLSARVSALRLSKAGMSDERGVKVVVVEIKRSSAIAASSDGKVLRRQLKADGSPETVPFYPHELITRLSTLGQLDYSAFPVPGSGIDDFDVGEVRHLRELLETNRSSDRTLLELDDEDLLAALRMTTVTDGTVTPTVTGLLLLGRHEAIARSLPTHGATFQVMEGTEVRVNQDFDQPLLYAIERMRALLDPWNPERELEYGLIRQGIPEFDTSAYREALVNAFGHRDYTMLGRVRVLVDESGLTITSPGGFIEGVNMANLLTVEPRGRNECLMGALKRIGLAERTGRGIDRIYEGSLRFGRPLPDYSETTSSSVRVFLARSAPDPNFMQMISEEQSRTGRRLSLRALLVLDALRSQRRLTLAELSDMLPFATTALRTTVEGLTESGLVEARGNSSSRFYMLEARAYARPGGAGEYVRQSDIDSIRYPELIMKLARHQGGHVTARDVEQLLRVTRRQALWQIKKLVADGHLQPRGRGRAAHYVVPESVD